MQQDMQLKNIGKGKEINMPVRKTKSGGYKYGKRGKTYYGKNAKKKATRQGKAIRAHGGK